MWNVKNFTTRISFLRNDSKNEREREIGKQKVPENKTLAINDIERFWDTICSEKKDLNENAEWIKKVQTNNANK